MLLKCYSIRCLKPEFFFLRKFSYKILQQSENGSYVRLFQRLMPYWNTGVTVKAQREVISWVYCTTTFGESRSLVCVRLNTTQIYACIGFRLFISLLYSQHCAGLQLFNWNKIFKSMLNTESQVFYVFLSTANIMAIACLKYRFFFFSNFI